MHELQLLLRDLFSPPSIPVPTGPSRTTVEYRPSLVVIGFAFNEDLAKLRNIFSIPNSHASFRDTSALPVPPHVTHSASIIDVQRAAMGRFGSHKKKAVMAHAVKHWQLVMWRKKLLRPSVGEPVFEASTTTTTTTTMTTTTTVSSSQPNKSGKNKAETQPTDVLVYDNVPSLKRLVRTNGATSRLDVLEFHCHQFFCSCAIVGPVG